MNTRDDGTDSLFFHWSHWLWNSYMSWKLLVSHALGISCAAWIFPHGWLGIVLWKSLLCITCKPMTQSSVMHLYMQSPKMSYVLGYSLKKRFCLTVGMFSVGLLLRAAQCHHLSPTIVHNQVTNLQVDAVGLLSGKACWIIQWVQANPIVGFLHTNPNSWILENNPIVGFLHMTQIVGFRQATQLLDFC